MKQGPDKTTPASSPAKKLKKAPPPLPYPYGERIKPSLLWHPERYDWVDSDPEQLPIYFQRRSPTNVEQKQQHVDFTNAYYHCFDLGAWIVARGRIGFATFYSNLPGGIEQHLDYIEEVREVEARRRGRLPGDFDHYYGEAYRT